MMRKKLLLILAVCAVSALSGCGKTSEESASIPETVPVAETVPVTEAPTEQATESEQTTEPAPETTEKVTPETDSQITRQEVVQAMQDAIQEEDYNVEFIYDDAQQAYVFTLWEDQFGEMLELIEGNSSGWETVRNQFLTVYTQTAKMMNELDSETSFILKIVDERDHNKNILVIQNDQITYDIMEEKTSDAEQNTFTVNDFAFSKQSIIDKLNETFSNSGRSAEAVYDESQNAYIISLWYDGLGQRIDNGTINDSSWENERSLFLVTYDSVKNILAQLDPDTPFILKVVDDRSHDKNLIVIENNEITYDILEQ